MQGEIGSGQEEGHINEWGGSGMSCPASLEYKVQAVVSPLCLCPVCSPQPETSDGPGASASGVLLHR